MNVEFNDPQYAARSRSQRKGGSMLTRSVISLGIAKDERGAQIALIVIAVLAIAGTALLIMYGLPEEVPVETPPDVAFAV